MRFPDSGRSEQNDVLLVFEKAQAGQFPNLALVNRRLKGEVKLIQPLLEGKVRPQRLEPDVALELGLTFRFEHIFQKLQIRLLLVRRRVRQLLVTGRQMKQAQALHQRQQALRLSRHGSPPRTRPEGESPPPALPLGAGERAQAVSSGCPASRD